MADSVSLVGKKDAIVCHLCFKIVCDKRSYRKIDLSDYLSVLELPENDSYQQINIVCANCSNRAHRIKNFEKALQDKIRKLREEKEGLVREFRALPGLQIVTSRNISALTTTGNILVLVPTSAQKRRTYLPSGTHPKKHKSVVNCEENNTDDKSTQTNVGVEDCDVKISVKEEVLEEYSQVVQEEIQQRVTIKAENVEHP